MKDIKTGKSLDNSLVNSDERHGKEMESNVMDPSRRDILKGAAGGALTIGTLALLNENAHAASSKPIPIGSMYPLTGAASMDGQGYKR